MMMVGFRTMVLNLSVFKPSRITVCATFCPNHGKVNACPKSPLVQLLECPVTPIPTIILSAFCQTVIDRHQYCGGDPAEHHTEDDAVNQVPPAADFGRGKQSEPGVGKLPAGQQHCCSLAD